MPLKTPTQLDLDRAAIDAAEDTAIRAVVAAIHAINGTYHVTWGLTEERLLAVLNDAGILQSLSKFAEHHDAGDALNGIAARANRPERAIVVAARPLRIRVESGDLLTPEAWMSLGMPAGELAFEPPPAPEPAPEPEPQPEEVPQP